MRLNPTPEDMLRWLDSKGRAFDVVHETDASPDKDEFAESAMLGSIRDYIAATLKPKTMGDKLTAGDLKK